MSFLVYLLGQPKISRGDALIHLPGYKPLALLAYLLVTGKAHSREHLVDLLYDDSADPKASLRWTLSHLRQAIGREYIQANRQQIAFNFDSDHWLDVTQLLTGDTDVYRGDFLEGLYIRDGQGFMDWAFFQRERYRRLYQAALAQQLQTHETQGNYEKVLETGHKLIHLDNLREEWHQALMRAYAQLGEREAALAQYEMCRLLLERELGVTPSEETAALYDLIQSGRVIAALSPSINQVDGSLQYPVFLQVAGVTEDERRPTFVARERELERLNGFLEKALMSNGQVAFVTGEAGQGKTTLMVEFALRAHAAHPDLLITWGSCDAYFGIGDPYLPFRDIMNMLAGDVRTRLAAGTMTRQQARRLWAVLPRTVQALVERGPELLDVFVASKELLFRLAAAVPLETAWLKELKHFVEREQVGMSGLEQQHLFEQFTNVLRTLAAQQPLVLLLDDLQWADTASVSLLFHLGRRLEGHRILLIGAYRPDEVVLGHGGKQHQLEKILTEFKRTFGDVWIDLSRAGEAEGRQFVDAFLDSEPNQLGVAFRQALYGRTAGHPLFTIELLRAMQERGDLKRDEAGQWVEGPTLDWERLPSRVQAVIEERIGRLEEESRQALMLASVEGEVFTAQVVAYVQGIGEHRLLSQLSQELEKRHRLVSEQGEVKVGEHVLSRYQFTHILFQRYLYQELSPGERRLLHGKVAKVLETLYEGHTDEIAIKLARHFQEAQIPEKSTNYLLQAGDQAMKRFAYKEAVELYNLAEVYLRELGEEAHWDPAITLYLSRGKALFFIGALNAAITDVQRATTLSLTHDDLERAAQAYNRMAQLKYRQGYYDETQSLAQKVITTWVDLISPDEVAQSYLWIGVAATSMLDYESALSSLKQAEKICMATDNNKVLALVLEGIAQVYYAWLDLELALEAMQRSVQLSRNFSSSIGLAAGLNNVALIQVRLGLPDEALLTLDEAIESLRDASPYFLAHFLVNRAEVLAYLGRFSRAGRDFEEAMRHFAQMNDESGMVEMYLLWGYEYSSVLSEWNDARYRFEQAKQLIELRPTSYPEEEARLLIGLGQVELRSGSVERAESLLRKGKEIIEEKYLAWWRPAVNYFLGLAKLAQQHFSEARAHFQVALDTVDKGGCPDYLPLVLLELAKLEPTSERKLSYLERCVQAARKRARYADRLHCFKAAGSMLINFGQPHARKIGEDCLQQAGECETRPDA